MTTIYIVYKNLLISSTYENVRSLIKSVLRRCPLCYVIYKLFPKELKKKKISKMITKMII